MVARSQTAVILDLCLKKTQSQLATQGLPSGVASLSITTQLARYVESCQERLRGEFASHMSQTEACDISQPSRVRDAR